MPDPRPAIGLFQSVLSYAPCNPQPAGGNQSATRRSFASSAAMRSGVRRSSGACSRSAGGRSLRPPYHAIFASSDWCGRRRMTARATSGRNRWAPTRTNPRWKCSYLSCSTPSMASASFSFSIRCQVALSRLPRPSMPRVGQRSSGRSPARTLSSSCAVPRRPASHWPSGSGPWPARAD